MFYKQKESILSILKSNETSRNYKNRYWFAYMDFLDPTDCFTEFSCENLDGKQGYIDLINKLLDKDETAKVFVEVYGYEENNDEMVINADTLIIFSKLSILEIEQIFNEPEDIFPSDIGEETNFLGHSFVVNENGDFISVADFSNDNYFVYYCWWD